jgi:MFS family permease
MNLSYKNYLLALLVLTGVVATFERFVFSLVLEPIKQELSLSDSQLGLMTGMAFFAFYAVAGIPIARWADRGNRVNIIALATGLLGAMVSLCGMAGSFFQLLLVRAGVAVGEAGIVPAAQSLLSDYFDRAERPRALALFITFYSISMIVGYLLGGALVEALGWRMTFVVMGVPGIVVALLVKLTLKEPRLSYPKTEVPHTPSLVKTFNIMWRQRTYRQILIGFCVAYFFNAGVTQWLATFYIRSYGISPGQLGAWLALAFGGVGTLGIFAGGYYASRFAVHQEKRQMRVLAVMGACAGPIAIAMYLAPSQGLSLVCLSIYAILTMFSNGPIFAAIQSLMPQQMRSISVAIAFLFANLIGYGLGPLALGALSDVLSPMLGKESLRYALVAFAPGTLWVSYYYWKASNTIEADIRSVELMANSAESKSDRINSDADKTNRNLNRSWL